MSGLLSNGTGSKRAMISAVCRALCPRASRQVHIRRRDAELLKKHVRHIGVVVLACVDQRLDDVLELFKRVHHGRHFHEIRTSAHEVKYVHKPLQSIA
jgi:hypothetical protein